MLRRAGQRAQSLHHDQECSAEGEGVVPLRTKRQGKTQLRAPRCPSRLPDPYKSFEHFLIRGKKKQTNQQSNNQTACKCSGCMLNKVFFSASSVEIKQFLFTIITSAFSQLCARVRA